MADEDKLTAWTSFHLTYERDYDQVAVGHSRTLLAGGSDRVAAILGDMRDAGAILTHPELRCAAG
jgi:hypothetical protein